MIKNYFKIAWRNLIKNKVYSFINIMGLGLAIPFAMLSLIQLQSTFEFDDFHKDSERIYRIITDETTENGTKTAYASSPFLLANNLRDNYPIVEKATKTVRAYSWELNNRLKSLRVNSIYVEPVFFEIFGFEIENGSLPIEPNSLVLSHEMAEKFFNKSNPVGQELTHPDLGILKISGVLKPFKKQTHFRSDVMVSMATFENNKSNDTKSWEKYDAHTFVKLKDKVEPKALSLAIAQIAKQTNSNLVLAKKSNSFRTQAMSDISPSSEKLVNNPYVEDYWDIVFNFSIPLMILLLAGFNYTNLTLARSLSRAREVGVRKVMGALRKQLILQFICEAVIIAFFALFIGFVILQFMKEFIHLEWITWEVENQTLLTFIFISFALVLGILAGILPAWVLSSFQAVDVLKGSISTASFGKISFRKSLIVIQFVVTMAFVFFEGHLYSQFTYMATENENFNRKGIFNITLSDKKYDILRSEIGNNKSVEKVGLASMPFGGMAAQNAIKVDKNSENTATFYYAADRNFIENMNLEFVAGQNLPESLADSASAFVVLNEKAIKKLALGTAKDAIGKSIILNNDKDLLITGVVKDFCHFNYQFEVEPLMLQYNPAQFNIVSIKVSDNTSEADFEKQMKAIWEKQFPYISMVSSWYEKEMYERYYPSEDLKIMGLSSLVILVIAVMGLLGMVIYTTEKRIKEIGIRKVMGANIADVVKILSWSFMKLLLIAGAIAFPFGIASGYALQTIFTFHSDLNFGLMLFFFASIIIIALVTIGQQSVKAAMMNPVKSLKIE